MASNDEKLTAFLHNLIYEICILSESKDCHPLTHCFNHKTGGLCTSEPLEMRGTGVWPNAKT